MALPNSLAPIVRAAHAQQCNRRFLSDNEPQLSARSAACIDIGETSPEVANVSERQVTADYRDGRNVAKCLSMTCRSRKRSLFPQGFRFIPLHNHEAGICVTIEVQEAERRTAARNCAFWLKQDGFAGRSQWIRDRIPRARHFYST